MKRTFTSADEEELRDALDTLTGLRDCDLISEASFRVGRDDILKRITEARRDGGL